ncbi:flagellar biosynthesis protein FliQ [Bacillus sp. FJAT-27916]|uniref:flagellar biosynthesis protein FliQ n=1 Tax=Bacillaceae TaxID=186817 RepID=UPI0006714510|nr:flagellar biosynthesis protein FliQ [Bacillus sp. FJAT-27916]KMY44993.1 flagellar biosynthesis protein FliQ [Bacillus sp. FJAT-27916]
MTAETVITLAERGVWTVLIISAPLLILALGIGLIVSIFQATTQIQEQTLAFIPKIAAVLLGIVFFGPWMLGRMMSFTLDIFSNLTKFVG